MEPTKLIAPFLSLKTLISDPDQDEHEEDTSKGYPRIRGRNTGNPEASERESDGCTDQVDAPRSEVWA